MNDILKFPLYAKLTAVLLGLIALIFVLYIGQDILVPVMMSFYLLFYCVSNSAVSKIETLLSTCFSSYAGCTFVCFVFIGVFVFLSFQIRFCRRF
jgi:predicted PurR-regulated permease PerM